MMIDYYLKFSIDKFGEWMDLLKLKTSYLKRSMMTAAIFAMNFFCISELVFNPTKTINGVSIIGGIIVFIIVSIYLVSKKKKFNLPDKDKNHRVMDLFLKIHVAATLLLYLFITFHYWE